MYVPKTSCMKGTSAHIYCRICDKTASCHCKVPDFAFFSRPKKFLGLLRHRPQIIVFINTLHLLIFLEDQLICYQHQSFAYSMFFAKDI